MRKLYPLALFCSEVWVHSCHKRRVNNFSGGGEGMKKTYEAMSVHLVGAVSTVINKSGKVRRGRVHWHKHRHRNGRVHWHKHRH